jgi:hypothetical protein
MALEMTTAVKMHSERLLNKAMGFVFRDDQPNVTLVDIKIAQGKYNALKELCTSVDAQARPDIEEILKEAQAQLSLAERVMISVQESGNSIETRLRNILVKMFRESRLPPPLNQKERLRALDQIDQCRSELTKIIQEEGEMSLYERPSFGHHMVNMWIQGTEAQLLQLAPQFIVLEEPLFDNKFDASDAVACKKIASAFFAQQYLERGGQDIKSLHLEAENLHQWAAEYLQRIANQDTRISFQPNSSSEDIHKRLRILSNIQMSKPQIKLGAYIDFGSQTLAMLFHPMGKISLFCPCGDSKRSNAFEVRLANSQQAAIFLKGLTREIRPVHAVSVEPTVLLDQPPVLLEERISEDDQENVDALETSSSSSEELAHFEKPPFLISLQNVVCSLSQQSEEGFCQALTFVEGIRQMDWNLPMSDHKLLNVLDRIYFHLYHIQDKEFPKSIDRKNYNWGSTAFHTKGLATPEQKMRAAQRVEIEVLLDLLSAAVENDDEESLRQYLGDLENLKLDRKDLPEAYLNAAHALFGKFYQAYRALRRENPSLEDPDQEAFHGDFGRIAFYSRGEIFAPTKQKVLKEMTQAFKKTWRI